MQDRLTIGAVFFVEATIGGRPSARIGESGVESMTHDEGNRGVWVALKTGKHVLVPYANCKEIQHDVMPEPEKGKSRK